MRPTTITAQEKKALLGAYYHEKLSEIQAEEESANIQSSIPTEAPAETVDADEPAKNSYERLKESGKNLFSAITKPLMDFDYKEFFTSLMQSIKEFFNNVAQSLMSLVADISASIVSMIDDLHKGYGQMFQTVNTIRTSAMQAGEFAASFMPRPAAHRDAGVDADLDVNLNPNANDGLTHSS